MQRRCLGREDLDRPRRELPLRVLPCPGTRTRAQLHLDEHLPY
jgi:hypothetical protein